jgi:hypothetical protein
MAGSTEMVDVYIEIGKKRTFAGAIDWPGWCRNGRNEQAALQALFDYGPRYAGALSLSRLGFQAPASQADLNVVDHFKGTTTTDFGAPDIAPPGDVRPFDATELRRSQAILEACWRSSINRCKSLRGSSSLKGLGAAVASWMKSSSMWPGRMQPTWGGSAGRSSRGLWTTSAGSGRRSWTR